ncbi:efflux RND transporter periplasmic adaptor subunit [Pseudoduganella sp. OTU4001]|uniref:efflux RND transporter periplasmic adaptor subunit n=1 Tax=Pseudoduganella sp. OTU4001 TaxID=3043854 RepID=UPI00313C7AFC
MTNKNVVLALAIAAILAVAGVFGAYQLGKRSAASAAAPVAGERKPLYWHDPMVPGQKFDKPGKSPFMDMQLVPVYSDDAGDSGGVSISPRVQQNLGVRTVAVTRAALPQALSAVGNVAFNEQDVTVVQARANGFVERVLVRSPLELVRKGQALAEVTMPEWIAAQEEFLAVRQMQSASAAMIDGARQRMRLAGMQEQQIRQVESGGRVQTRQTLTAPSSGVVTELLVREGMAVAMGAPLYRINGLESVWVNAELPESVLARVAPGSKVTARTTAEPGQELSGKVAAILPEVNPATRTVRARIVLSNPGGRLMPGMFVTMDFAARNAAPVLLVPTEAVIRTGTRSVVMLEQGAGKFAPVQVELGAEANGQSEIRAGLQEGQKVAVSGQFLIDSEASLKGSTQRMEGAVTAMTHQGEGLVESIDKEEITLSHGPIATMKWPAMTMGFKLPRGGVPVGVAAGTRVTFRFVQRADGSFEVTQMAPVAAGDAHQHGERK